MTSRPEPHRDQRTIGSFKKTANAALLIWVANRSRGPAPQRLLGPARVLTLAGAAALLAAAGIDPGALPGLG